MYSTIINLSFNLYDSRGQAHDGAANALGGTGSVKRVQDDHPKVLTAHCLVHYLHLAMKSVRTVFMHEGSRGGVLRNNKIK